MTQSLAGLSSEEKSTIINALTAPKSYTVQLSLLAFLYLHKAQSPPGSEFESLRPVFSTAKQISQTLNVETTPDLLFFGSFLTIKFILTASGLLDDEGPSLVLNEDLAQAIEKILSFRPSDGEKLYNQILAEEFCGHIRRLNK